MARQTKVSKTITEDKSGVSFEFADGTTLVAKLSEIPEETQRELMLHGLSQKIGDSYSGEDAENCFTIAESVYNSLKEGKWSTRSGGTGGPRISQLAEALHRVTGEELVDCVAKIADMSDEQKAGLRGHSAIKAEIANIKLEKAQADAAKAAESADGDEVDLADLMS